MIKSQQIKTLFLISFLSWSIVACKKKETETQPAIAAPPCFNSQYNGTYTGSGTSALGSYTLGSLSLTKSGCESITLILNTNTPYNFNDNVTQLSLNSSGGYYGKQSNGNNITITLGSILNVKAAGSFTFAGSK